MYCLLYPLWSGDKFQMPWYFFKSPSWSSPIFYVFSLQLYHPAVFEFPVFVVQSPSQVQVFVTPWTAAHQASLFLTISRSLPKFMSIASVTPSSHLILWCSLLLPSIFPSIRNFPNESAVCIRWPKYWSFSFNVGPSNEYSGFLSLKINWFDLLAVQGTLRSILQHHSWKASILWHSAFFTVQLSQLYVITGKTIASTIWTFVSRVMSLLFNTQSRFVIVFLPRSKRFLISWLQSPSTEPKKRKSVTSFTFSLQFSMDGCHDLDFLIFSFKSALSLSSLILIKMLFSSSLVSSARVVIVCISEVIDVSPTYSSSTAFLMVLRI